MCIRDSPEGSDDDPIHTQILVKKVIDDEWKTKSEYERNETEKAFADTLYRREQARKVSRGRRGRGRNRRNRRGNDACIQARWNDYDNLLQGLSEVETAYAVSYTHLQATATDDTFFYTSTYIH